MLAALSKTNSKLALNLSQYVIIFKYFKQMYLEVEK